jgi:hypothetical protein
VKSFRDVYDETQIILSLIKDYQKKSAQVEVTFDDKLNANCDCLHLMASGLLTLMKRRIQKYDAADGGLNIIIPSYRRKKLFALEPEPLPV